MTGIMPRALAWSLSAFDPGVDPGVLDGPDFSRLFFPGNTVSLDSVARGTELRGCAPASSVS